MGDSHAKITANFTPQNSAVFTLGSLTICALIFISGVWLCHIGSWIGLLPIIAGASGMAFSFKLGFKSQRDQDLTRSKSLEMNFSPDGSFSLSTDPRTDREIMLDIIAAVAEMMNARKPLPSPSGKVDAQGNIDESLKDSAVKEVAKINTEIESDCSKLQHTLTSKKEIEVPKISRDCKLKNIRTPPNS